MLITLCDHLTYYSKSVNYIFRLTVSEPVEAAEPLPRSAPPSTQILSRYDFLLPFVYVLISIAILLALCKKGHKMHAIKNVRQNITSVGLIRHHLATYMHMNTVREQYK